MRRALCLLALSLCVPSGAVGPKKSKPAARPDPAAPTVEKAVREYVRDQVEEEGSFTVEDDVLGKSWDAKLVAVRVGEMRRHPGGQVSVCVDFRAEEGRHSQPMDLDFVLSEADGEWVIEDTLIHKVGKTPRFTYGPKLERLPVKGGKAAKSAVPAGEPGE